MKKCSACNGKGEIDVDEGAIDMSDMLPSIICPVCDGEGVVNDAPEEGWIVISFEHSFPDDEGLTFWRPNSLGYTVFLSAAGRYSYKEAENICTGANYTEIDEIAITVDDAKRLALKTSKNGEHLVATLEELKGMVKGGFIKPIWPEPKKPSKKKKKHRV